MNNEHILHDPTRGRTPSGDGEARETGYGAGGLGAGGDRAQSRPDSWNAPGTSPDGERTGAPDDGPKTGSGAPLAEDG